MKRLRKAAVAGTFYPAEPSVLSELVASLLKAASSSPSNPSRPAPKALIAPHAGYQYSGPIAASAYRLWEPLRGTVKRLLLLGPAHRVPIQGLALPSVEAFETPAGTVHLDTEAIAALKKLPQVRVSDPAHEWEHSLEVHLPFLQNVLGNFRLVPLVVGDASPEEVAEILELLWGGEETRIVISSDLSHYHDYATAKKRDQKTSEAIVALRGESIHDEDACGQTPIRGLLQVAGARHLQPLLVDQRNSGDTAGSKDRVVGYGSYAFFEPTT